MQFGNNSVNNAFETVHTKTTNVNTMTNRILRLVLFTTIFVTSCILRMGINYAIIMSKLLTT